MNWRCPKQVPHYPPGFSFYLENLTSFANLFVQCEKNLQHFPNQKIILNGQILHYQNSFSKIFPIFGSKKKKTKFVKIKNHN